MHLGFHVSILEGLEGLGLESKLITRRSKPTPSRRNCLFGICPGKTYRLLVKRELDGNPSGPLRVKIKRTVESGKEQPSGIFGLYMGGSTVLRVPTFWRFQRDTALFFGGVPSKARRHLGPPVERLE